MKKMISIALMAIMTLSLAACANTEVEISETTTEPTETTTESTATTTESAIKEATETISEDVSTETVIISVQNGVEEMIDLEVPFDPQRIVVVDYVALDMLISWGLGDRVVGMPKSGPPIHLQEFAANEEVVNLGGLKETDMEAVMSLEPDLIFTSGRTAALYDDFSEIAPTVMTNVDYSIGTYNSVIKTATRNASIFGLESKVAEQLSDFEERIAKLAEVGEGKTAIIGIMTGGSLATLGNDSRGSMIVSDIKFENLATEVDTTHGNTASYELLVELDPDYIFILDRDIAIATDGATNAQQLMDNELVHQTSAYQNDNIVYLTPSVWYLCEGGIGAMDIMLSDLEAGILK